MRREKEIAVLRELRSAKTKIRLCEKLGFDVKRIFQKFLEEDLIKPYSTQKRRTPEGKYVYHVIDDVVDELKKFKLTPTGRAFLKNIEKSAKK